jgi:glucose-1-phosphate adenylyltransferase
VGAEARVGWGDDNSPNRSWPERLNTGITLVGRAR